MATQSCPRCKSDRIRHGYRPTSFWQKLMFRYNLLCNNCNWEFVGFAIPGTVSSRGKRRKDVNYHNHTPSLKVETDNSVSSTQIEKQPPAILENQNLNGKEIEKDFIVSQKNKKKRNKVRKRVRVKLS